MITDKDYYEAKKLIAKYESMQLNKLDVSGMLAMRFNKWISENNWSANINGKGWFKGNSRFFTDAELWGMWLSSDDVNYH